MKSNKDLVSIIMSVYNSENTVARSIDSIKDQTYQNIEILIMNDGSNDESLKIIKEYENQDNIKIFNNKENIGLTKSLNILINNASGKYIARQDSDDLSYPFRIQEQIENIQSYNLDFSTSRAHIIGSKRKIPGLSFYFPNSFLMKYKNPFIHGTMVIKKSVIEEVGLYNESFYYAQDYKLMKDLLSKGFKYRTIKKPLYELNMENNISTKHKKEQKRYADYVRKGINP